MACKTKCHGKFLSSIVNKCSKFYFHIHPAGFLHIRTPLSYINSPFVNKHFPFLSLCSSQYSHRTSNNWPVQLLVFLVHVYPLLRYCTISIFSVFSCYEMFHISSNYLSVFHYYNPVKQIPVFHLFHYYSNIRSSTQCIFRLSCFRCVFFLLRCLQGGKTQHILLYEKSVTFGSSIN